MPATRYAFLGPAGTFAHAAAQQLADAETVLVPHASVTQAIDALHDGAVDGAVVPLENSVEGAVPATLDALTTERPLVIGAETFLPVIFDLVARPGTELAAVRSIATHPHAEAQVRRYLLSLLPAAGVTPLGSTAAGAQAVAAGRFDAAVAPAGSAQLYQLAVLAHDIADQPGAVTRFVLLSRPRPAPPPTGNDRTTLVAYLRDNHAGALLQLLTEFATRGVNLTRIESRPTKGQLGQYCFSIDCEGHLADDRVADALTALHRVCAGVRYLGSYQRRDGQQGPVPAGGTDADFAAAAAWLASVRKHGTA
ncbi:MAG: prephenate dehydratase [Jatrophihabitantaceae bacterium]